MTTFPILIVTSGTHLLSTSYVDYLVDSSSGPTTLNLPKILSAGTVLYITREDKSVNSNTTTVNTDAKDTINWNLTSITIGNGTQIRLVSTIDGTNGNWNTGNSGATGSTGNTGPSNYIMAGNTGLTTFTGPITSGNFIIASINIPAVIFNDNWIVGTTGISGNTGTAFYPQRSGLYMLNFNIEVLTSSQTFSTQQSDFIISFIDTANPTVDIVGTNRNFSVNIPTGRLITNIVAEISINVLANIVAGKEYTWKYVMRSGTTQQIQRCFFTATLLK